jgi:3-methylcrotonyl-CoA carboxylase alpha subunit
MKPSKVLIANRSEIACRIMQACREMGIRSVAICAPGDEEARHLTYADEVQSVKGYLEVDSIVEAARRSGAHFIHPGYGFLSERPAFARAVTNAGLVFVGPTAETMELMGGKIGAKELALKEKVPTLPFATVARGGDLKAEAKRIGFPLLIKAASGGGGKGMRRVDRAQDLEAAAESASAEALAAFGDGTLFLERLVLNPRHIEVQVFGDGRGGAIHLHERECSLQRRHQKVWEEATPPHLPAAVKVGLDEAALRLARAVKYRSAGTMEFLVDDAGGFYFLEMNTRLQVEHPVTELVTGVDLVCAQLAQARAPGDTVLSHVPEVRGHAIEVRLYAEDPAQGFRPTPGRIERLRWPMGPGIRVDSGIEEGQTIGTQFDSMLAKLIVHAPTRDHAIHRLRYALEETVILGIGSNQSYLLALTRDPHVLEGRVHTGYLGEAYAAFAPELAAEEASLLESARAQGLARGASVQAAGAGSTIPSPWTAFGGGA